MNPIVVSSRRSGFEWLIPSLLGLLAAASVAAVWSRHTGAWMDTLHYVEAAEGLARGGLPWIISPFYATRFLFMDGVRTLTEWPLLFPAAIAVLIRLGLDGVFAARLLSAAGFAAIPFALWPLARRFLSVRKATAVVILTLCSGGLYHHATAGMSETLSIALMIAGVSFAERFGESFSGSPSRLAAYGAWIFLGASGATRYAGGFALPAVCAWLFLRALPTGKIRWVMVWSAGMAVIAGFPFLFKRYASVYSVFDRGPLSDLRYNVIQSVWHGAEDLLLGGWPVPLWVAVVLLALALSLVVMKAIRTPLPAVRSWVVSPEGLCAAVAASYLTLIIWTASHRTIDPVNTRYMMPLYPFVFLVIAGAAGSSRRLVAVALISAGLGIAGARNTVTHELISDDFISPPETIAWLKANAAPTDVIITTDWHFARWLGRPVYDLPTWDWSGYTFSPADALLSAHAGRKVFVVVRDQVQFDAVRGKNGEYGAYIKGLVETGQAPFARVVATLPDDVIYSFDAAWKESAPSADAESIFKKRYSSPDRLPPPANGL